MAWKPCLLRTVPGKLCASVSTEERVPCNVVNCALRSEERVDSFQRRQMASDEFVLPAVHASERSSLPLPMPLTCPGAASE